LQWGAELADKEGFVTWLEASPKGYSVYRKFGFEDVDVQDLQIKDKIQNIPASSYDPDFGGANAVELAGPLVEGAFRTVYMKRLPRPLLG
jgi:hypothetical protein